MLRPAGDPVVDIGAEVEHAAGSSGFLDLELDGKERSILDGNAALLDRRNQKIFLAFALEHGSEQLDERVPPDRSFEIVPGAVRRDAHVEVAAKRRVPKLDRRRS